MRQPPMIESSIISAPKALPSTVKCRSSDRHRWARDEPHRAAHVTERRCVEQRLGQLRNAPVTPAKESAYIRAIPDEIPNGSGAKDEVAVLGIGEQLPNVGWLERSVGLKDADEVRVR